MGTVPKWLLGHEVTVEAYQGWNTYGAPTALRCLVAQFANSKTPPGESWVASPVLYAKPDAPCPAGSRITLPDGTRGYASSVVIRDGGGLPTPDHAEITVTVAGSFGPPFGESVTLLRRTLLSRDAAGSTRWTTTSTTHNGCAVRILGSTENVAGDGHTVVVDTLEVILPPATATTAGDQIRVRGLLYDVDGTPEQVGESTSEAHPGVKVTARRATES